MMPRIGANLRTRLLLALLIVVAVAVGTVFVVVGLVAPGAFEGAMGTVGGMMGGAIGGMDEMMSGLVRTAFQDAVRTALLAAALVATVVAVIVSLVVSGRLTRPIIRLAAASRRIAGGHYAERVAVASGDEIGELAASFNVMAASLESTERRRLQLVGDVAHELRTPLATLDGYLEGLEDGVVAPNAGTWSLLRGETARLSRLVNDLQQLWRAEARQIPLKLEAVDTAGLLARVVERFRPVAAQQGITLQVSAASGLAPARADRERLEQSLDNLVTNAVRHAPDGSTVQLEARSEGRELILAVLDEGPGLDTEQLGLVFERFYRADASRSRALGGSGIGLAIAKALTEAMGGRIWAESAGPGTGASFLIALPRAG